MANAHFGNLADVFKHLALAEVLGAMRPQEYWESHAGSAFYAETAEPTAERQHGVHTFLRVAGDFEALRFAFYFRILSAYKSANPPAIPGSPLLARTLTGESVRRLLFCDLDTESLVTVRSPLPVPKSPVKDVSPDKLECVQDDGVSVLRGAGLLLPEQWTATTLAFIDPYDMSEPTDAGISPLELACELAARPIPTMLFYAFNDDAGRARQQERIAKALEKSRLLKHGAHCFEGSLKKTPPTPAPATQWGFGLLTVNLRAETLNAIEQKFRALEAAYERTELAAGGAGSGAWRYVHTAM